MLPSPLDVYLRAIGLASSVFHLGVSRSFLPLLESPLSLSLSISLSLTDSRRAVLLFYFFTSASRSPPSSSFFLFLIRRPVCRHTQASSLVLLSQSRVYTGLPSCDERTPGRRDLTRARTPLLPKHRRPGATMLTLSTPKALSLRFITLRASMTLLQLILHPFHHVQPTTKMTKRLFIAPTALHRARADKLFSSSSPFFLIFFIFFFFFNL